MPEGYASNPRLELLKDLNIGVFLGGDSPEREISLLSGEAVHAALARKGFSSICLDPSDQTALGESLQEIDLAFIAMHGSGGEDGILQSFLEERNIPYVGSSPSGCLQAFDKQRAKSVFERFNIPTPPYRVIRRENWRETCESFSVPFFVKPLRDGSSLGIFCVDNLEEETGTLEKALAQYGELMIEKKIVGREFTVGILGEKALPVIELRPKNAFYDYQAKYTKGMCEYLVPAPISRGLRSRLQKLGLDSHKWLGLRDFSRVDIMVDLEGAPYVLEANAIPGFTELSLLPKAARAAGISFEELCSELVLKAYERSQKGFLKKGGMNGKKTASKG